MNEELTGRGDSESVHRVLWVPFLLAAALLCLITLSGCWRCREWHEWHDRAGHHSRGWLEEDLIRHNGEPDFRVVGFDRLAESLSNVELRSTAPIKNIPSCASLLMPYRDFIMRCIVQGNIWEGVMWGGERPYDKGWYLKPPATTDVLLIYAEDLQPHASSIAGPPVAYIHIFRQGKYHDCARVFPWNSSLCDLARVSVKD